MLRRAKVSNVNPDEYPADGGNVKRGLPSPTANGMSHLSPMVARTNFPGKEPLRFSRDKDMSDSEEDEDEDDRDNSDIEEEEDNDPTVDDNDDDDDDDDDDEDYVINIKEPAMVRLRELKSKQDDPSAPMTLRMGVRSGGCSGMSYVMDFTTEDDVNDDDEIDEYPQDGIKCVVDSKSLLYLYGLELDYSDELIGGGFKFFNPNAEEACGCGSSFGV